MTRFHVDTSRRRRLIPSSASPELLVLAVAALLLAGCPSDENQTESGRDGRISADDELTVESTVAPGGQRTAEGGGFSVSGEFSVPPRQEVSDDEWSVRLTPLRSRSSAP